MFCSKCVFVEFCTGAMFVARTGGCVYVCIANHASTMHTPIHTNKHIHAFAVACNKGHSCHIETECVNGRQCSEFEKHRKITYGRSVGNSVPSTCTNDLYALYVEYISNRCVVVVGEFRRSANTASRTTSDNDEHCQALRRAERVPRSYRNVYIASSAI